jgi:hypothetical protein
MDRLVEQRTGDLHPAALLVGHDLPIEAGVDAGEAPVEEAFLQGDLAVEIGFGGGDHAVEIDLQRGVEVAVHRGDEGVGQHVAATRQTDRRQHRGGQDQARRERV